MGAAIANLIVIPIVAIITIVAITTMNKLPREPYDLWLRIVLLVNLMFAMGGISSPSYEDWIVNGPIQPFWNSLGVSMFVAYCIAFRAIIIRSSKEFREHIGVILICASFISFFGFPVILFDGGRTFTYLFYVALFCVMIQMCMYGINAIKAKEEYAQQTKKATKWLIFIMIPFFGPLASFVLYKEKFDVGDWCEW